MARYGWWIIAAVVLVLAAIGGFIWWQDQQEVKAGEQGETLLAALDSIDAGNRSAAAPKLDELAASDVDGYRAAALFARASSQAEASQVRGGDRHLALDRRRRGPRRALSRRSPWSG